MSIVKFKTSWNMGERGLLTQSPNFCFTKTFLNANIMFNLKNGS